MGLTRSRGREHRSSGGRKAQAKERKGKGKEGRQAGRNRHRDTPRKGKPRDETSNGRKSTKGDSFPEGRHDAGEGARADAGGCRTHSGWRGGGRVRGGCA